MPDLSVIVVSFNTRQLLADCLHSLETCRGEIDFETLVVDNASADGSAEMVARDFPEVRLLRSERNRGFAAANNHALSVARGRHLMLLNSDTVVHPGALGELVRWMDGHPEAGYCGPRLLNGDGTHQASARRFPTVWSRAFAVTGLAARHPDSLHCLDLHLRHGSTTTFPADWLTGACLVVRRDAYEQAGPLDEGYFMYFEETDWCRRMARLGWSGWYMPAAQVTHLGGRSVQHGGIARPFWGNHPVHWVRSRRRYLRRHCGAAAMIFAEAMDAVCHAVIWLRHMWRASEFSRSRARCAAAALRHLLPVAPR